MAKTITIEIKTSKFEVKQRSITLNHYIHRQSSIEIESQKLLRQLLPIQDMCRMVGVRLSNIRKRSEQVECPEESNPEDKNSLKDGVFDFERARMNASGRKAMDYFVKKDSAASAGTTVAVSDKKCGG